MTRFQPWSAAQSPAGWAGVELCQPPARREWDPRVRRRSRGRALAAAGAHVVGDALALAEVIRRGDRVEPDDAGVLLEVAGQRVALVGQQRPDDDLRLALLHELARLAQRHGR